MILRCWLVVWVKWARPLVSMTLWSRVMFNWKAVQLRGRPISWAVLHHWKSMGQILVPSCPPGGATFTPFWGMVLQSLAASSNVGNFTFLWNPLSELRGVKSFSQCKVNGATLGRSCPPGVQLLPHFEVWSYRACQPLEMWQISHFCEIHSLSYEASKFFSMLSLCVFFCPYFAPGANIVPRSLIKVIAHDSRLGRTFWHLIHGSVTKTVGGVARRNKSGRRRRISMSNNNTVLCH